MQHLKSKNQIVSVYKPAGSLDKLKLHQLNTIHKKLISHKLITIQEKKKNLRKAYRATEGTELL